MSDRRVDDQIIDEILSEVAQSKREEAAPMAPAHNLEPKANDPVLLYLSDDTPKKESVPRKPSKAGEDTAEFSLDQPSAPAKMVIVPSPEKKADPIEEESDDDMKIAGGVSEPTKTIDPEMEETRELPKLSVSAAATRSFDSFGGAKPIDSQKEAEDKKTAGKKTVEQMEGQISFGDLVDEPEPEPVPEPEPEPEVKEEPLTWEERLQRVREEKIKNFRLTGEEEENDPEEEPEYDEEPEESVPEEEDLDEFTSYDDAPAIAAELSYQRRSGFIGLGISILAELALVWLSVVLHISRSINISPYVYVGVNLFLLGLLTVLNHRIITHGLSALFHGDPDADTAVAIAPTVVLIQTAVLLFKPNFVTATPMAMLPAAAGMILLFGCIGRLVRTCRMQENFRFMATRGDKYAAHLISDSEVARALGRPSIAIGDPEVLYFKKVGFLTRFLYHSCDENALPWVHRWLPIMGAGFSLLTALLYWLIASSASWLNALTVFSSLLCLVTPVAALMIDNVPLRRAAKRALSGGSMIASWAAVREFAQPAAMMVDALDLFPKNSVVLHGIKTFSSTRIDSAILDAASVTVQAGGPLSSVFLRVIEGKTDILQEVDTLVYEQEMGLSGWVDGRRVLVGNRRLLENHGVDVPSYDYESKYVRGGRKLVYLSVGGELSAMFVISYTADADIKAALQEMSRIGVTVLVRTCDPNITEQVVREAVDLEPYSVEVMTAAPARTAEQLVEGCDREQDALLSSNGQVKGMAIAVTACTRLQRVSNVGWWLQFALTVVAVLIGLITVIGGATVAPLYTALYLAFSGIVVALVQRCLKI